MNLGASKKLQLTLLLTLILSSCEAEVFHVTPILPATQPCPPPCHTLNQYTQNTSLFAGHTNIVLLFQNGVHNLSYSLVINMFNSPITKNSLLQFQGQGGMPEDTVINLLPSVLIYLSGITFLDINNILMKNSPLTLSSIIFGVDQIMYIRIRNCTVISHGDVLSQQFIGVLFKSVQNVTIEGSTFLSVGNWLTSEQFHIFLSANTVTIQDSMLSGGQHGVTILKGAMALVKNTYISEISNTGIVTQAVDEVIFHDCILSDGLYGALINGTSSVVIHKTYILGNGRVNSFGLLLTNINSVIIAESFMQNHLAASLCYASRLTVYNTNFTRSIVGLYVISAEFVSPHLWPYLPFENFTCTKCSFLFNGNGVTFFNVPLGTIFKNCKFLGNSNSGMHLYKSTIELRGETVFSDNTAARGGGIALFDSKLIFGAESNTTFINNSAAEFGGAIYIHARLDLINNIRYNIPVLGRTIEFPFALDECFYETKGNNSVIFIENKAEFGGHDIYGATLYTEQCSLRNEMFQFDGGLTPFKISSDPTRVCFCNSNEPQCENRTYLMLNETRYPGETFKVSVVLTGYNFGRVAGSVYTNVLGGDYKQVISESQHVQTVELMECTNISYTVFSSQDDQSVQLVLTENQQATQTLDELMHQDSIDLREFYRSVDSEICSEQNTAEFPCTILINAPIFINITTESCPLGFKLNQTRRICECDRYLKSIEGAVLYCEIVDRTGYITREGTVWVGVDTSEINTDIYYWHRYRYCPKDYCISSTTSIDLRFPDEQCSSNHSGIMCGKCQTNYSLQLGGNKCIKCTDNHLALLTVFAALGVLLVAVVKLLDLTVSSGTVSGLIFYANVVWSNNAILFSLQDRQNIGYYVVTLPIAWINLDFGIETCFSENLDQLTKTSLQFLFPVYIWCIAILIIIVSHYSTRATKLFGNNSVAVLATLFLLSYGKLFRAITDVFTSADITDSNGVTRKVWSLDGNVQYGVTPFHIGLLVLALLFLILFILPFTLTLLLVPFLRAKSHLRPLRWVNILKPFFDTYYGPFKYKKQHQVWTGILLISRVVILIVFASTSTYSPNGNILLITLISTLLLLYNAMVGLLYKKWSLSLLENTFIVNLVFLGAVYTTQQNSLQPALNPVLTVSVIIALFIFICTVIGHTIKRITSTEGNLRKIRNTFNKRLQYKNILLNPPENDDTQMENEHASIEEDELHSYTGGARAESQEGRTHPSLYDPPVIQSALILDQLREPALDILDPVTAGHYREATRRRQFDPPPREPTTQFIDKPTHQVEN